MAEQVKPNPFIIMDEMLKSEGCDPISTIDDTPGATPNRLQYPYSDKYEYSTRLVLINFDEESERDIANNNGFILHGTQSFRKDLKNEDGMFSSRFGQGLQDAEPFIDRYRCKCGALKGKLNLRIICPTCGHPVKFTDDNFKYFGWLRLNDYVIIHPSMFNSIKYLIGADRLDKILKYEDVKDQDGLEVEKEFTSIEDSFKGIGLIGFYERFDEIINYFGTKYKSKAAYYEDIIENRDLVFTHNIPVYTLLLRPYQIQEGRLYFEGSNACYRPMCSMVEIINNGSSITRKKKPINTLLYDLQTKFNKLIKDLDLIISGKKGTIRGLFGGRYNFTSRCVIIPKPSYKVDEIGLPYTCLMTMLQQPIINIIRRTYNIGYISAYMRWYDGLLKPDQIMVDIINTIIKNHHSGRGIPFIINRNPTINYGSIMQLYCVECYVDSYAMGTPLQILAPLVADYDGDVLNILWIINNSFLEYAERVFNPRNAMFISRDDGYMNPLVAHNRDTMLTASNIKFAGMDEYTPNELAEIEGIKAYWESIIREGK